ncbi:MAG: hypothetical protein P4L27_06395 [Ignavibacteriaceae bacterium]|nr:hypothetical protein [Ignavibacteriaceae bacterium]
MNNFINKSIVTVFLIIILNALPLTGQTSIPLDSMKTPESPAFMLLGISPTNFAKPETPNAFAVNVLNGLSSKELIPQNFAIETAPYWWFYHPQLTFREYINPTICQSIQQNFSFSAATSKLSGTPGGSYLAGGIRTIICPGSFNTDNLDTLIKEYHVNSYKRDFYTNGVIPDITVKEFNLDSIIDNELKESRIYLSSDKYISEEETKQMLIEIEKIKNDYFKSGKKPKDSTEAVKMANELISQTADKEKLQNTLTEIRSINKKKTGFIMDFALAGAGFFEGDSVKNGEFSKWGLWITPTYCNENFDLLFILKFLNGKDTTGWKGSGNTGIRLLYTSEAFGISFETEGKFSSGRQPNFRYILNFNYDIGKNTYLTATFGKDFQGNIINGNGDLITLLGINFGLGNAPSVTSK